ncbi:hypothetical protein J2T08_001873 [Neorhizobium galegae]|nr:hypothetical protein [Neorhizobium galegae]MDQ0133955.1 hypothetical protein [Neorhizobium galegae]
MFDVTRIFGVQEPQQLRLNSASDVDIISA